MGFMKLATKNHGALTTAEIYLQFTTTYADFSANTSLFQFCDVQRGALLLVPQWQWISSFVFYILLYFTSFVFYIHAISRI